MNLSPINVWNNCLASIKNEVSNQCFKTWFEPIKAIQYRDNTLTLGVPSKFFYEFLEENYIGILRNAVDKSIGQNGQLEYSIFVDRKPSNSAILSNNVKVANFPNLLPNAIAKSPFEIGAIDQHREDSYLNPAYTFQSYVEGDCNALARAAGLAVAAKPGSTSFNPLMIYGHVGLGKTHLLQAIGNQIKLTMPHKFVLYVSSEKFTNQFINAVKSNTLQSFTNFYMNVDVLLLDDVQFLANKDKTQETFFHIFNHLHQTGKQIVMTSDRAPKKLEGFMDRLLSRFKWGLTTDLQRPDFETKYAIIAKKLESDGIEFSNEVVEYIANSVNTNIRELEGVLVSLMAYTSLHKKHIDIDIAKKTVKSIVQKYERVISMDSILEVVKDHYGKTVEDIRGKSRKKEFMQARMVAMYLIKELMITPLVNIGYFFNRDHTSILYSVNAISQQLNTDSILAETIEKLKKDINRL
jgi:chromosomal replication initiator protein